MPDHIHLWWWYLVLKSSTDVVVHTYGKLPEELRASH